MRRLFVIIIVLVFFACKKKDSTPAEETIPTPAVKEYSPSASIDGPKTIFSSGGNHYNIYDTVYFAMVVNSHVLFTDQQPWHLYNGSTHFNYSPSLKVKTGDTVQWSARYVTYNTNALKAIFRVGEIWLTDIQNNKTSHLSNAVDTVPIVFSGNIGTGSRAWEITVP
jgi:hypothetical protein